MSDAFGGIIPALVTPLDREQRLNESAFEKLLARVYAGGVDGVYLCGSTGEGLLLPSAVRKRIVELAVHNSPAGKSIVVHVGAWNFETCQDLSRHAADSGVSAISALPPAGATFPELLAYYRALAGTATVPFLAYYFPSVMGGPLSLTQLEQIGALPGIVGLKFTDYDLYTLSLLVRGGKVVFNGRDEVLAGGLLLGASGGIGSIYNVVPEWFVELWNHARADRWPEARKVQDRINDLIRVLLRFPFMPALKQLMTWEGIECGSALRPRIPLTGDEESELRASLEPLLPLAAHS